MIMPESESRKSHTLKPFRAKSSAKSLITASNPRDDACVKCLTYLVIDELGSQTVWKVKQDFLFRIIHARGSNIRIDSIDFVPFTYSSTIVLGIASNLQVWG